MKYDLCIHWKDACCLETLLDSFNLEGRHLGGPEEPEEAAFLACCKALGVVKVGSKFYTVSGGKRRKHDSVKRLKIVRCME
jgi:hypothetical protein